MKKLLTFVACVCLSCAVAFPASKPASRPSSSSSSSKPASRPSPKTSTPASRPTGKPQSSTPSTPPPASKPASRPTTSPTPTPTGPKPATRPTASVTPAPSGKPTGKTFDAAAGKAQKEAESKAAFKAANAPKPSYKNPQGKVVNINPKSNTVVVIRQTVTPERYKNRTVRIEHHYHDHYGPRYDYYRSRPMIYVGGGYSSVFWYTMLDWSLERRALWLYHNQRTIQEDLYLQQLQNAQLRAEIERIRLRNLSVNSDYIDPEFKDEPDLMYSDDHIDAIYNPVPVQPIATPYVPPTPLTPEQIEANNAAAYSFLKFFLAAILVGSLVGVIIWAVFFKNWNISNH